MTARTARKVVTQLTTSSREVSSARQIGMLGDEYVVQARVEFHAKDASESLPFNVRWQTFIVGANKRWRVMTTAERKEWKRQQARQRRRNKNHPPAAATEVVMPKGMKQPKPKPIKRAKKAKGQAPNPKAEATVVSVRNPKLAKPKVEPVAVVEAVPVQEPVKVAAASVAEFVATTYRNAEPRTLLAEKLMRAADKAVA